MFEMNSFNKSILEKSDAIYIKEDINTYKS